MFHAAHTGTIGYTYLRQSKQSRADGSTLSHLQIAESVWDPLKKRSRVHIVYNCGRSDDPEVTERLRRLARSILKCCSPEEIVAQDPSWRVLDAWPYGDVHVLERLWRRVGLPELIGELVGARKFKFPVERALFAMVANRACAPSSKLYCHEDLSGTTMDLPGARVRRPRSQGVRKVRRRRLRQLQAGRPRPPGRAAPRNGRLPMPVEESWVRSLFDVVRVDPARSGRGGAPVAFVVFRKTVE